MGETEPRNIVISMIVLVFAITAMIFMIKQSYIGTAMSTPGELTALEQEFAGVNTTVADFSSGVEGSFDEESKKGWVTKSCTSLLGSDNFFCAGIDTLGSVKDAPSTFKTTINLFKSSFPIEIPIWIFTTITSIVGVIIVFSILSALRRYKS